MKTRIRLFCILLLGLIFFASCHQPEGTDSSAAPQETTTAVSESTAKPPTEAPATTETDTTEPDDGRAAVTLMIYMTGSDLESSSAAATKDMEEMLASGLDLTDVNVVIFTGGSETWYSDVPADKNALLRMTADGFVVEETFELMSMGDPANLTRFLNYAEEHYPARQFDLILWDHGNGPLIGYGKDKIHKNDSMTLLELGSALADSPFGPDRKLGFIGFDACLMASAELVCITGDYAEYLVSSQETEPNFGWNYACLEGLGTLKTLDFTRQIVEQYLDYCEDYFEDKAFFHSDVTMSVVDLSHAAELKAALNALFADAADDVSGDYNKLAVSRIKARSLGRASTGSEYDLVDLESLMDSMSERYPEKTKAVLDTLGAAVMVSGSNAPECCGLSIYYPYYNKAYYNRSWREEYNNLAVFPDYLTYLERYEKIWLGTDLKELFEGQLVPRNGEDAETYTLQLTEEQAEAYAAGQYYILERMGAGLYTLVYVSNDVENEDGLLIASFDGRVIYYGNDYGVKGIPLSLCGESVQGFTDYTVLLAALERGNLFGNDWERKYIRYQLSLNEEDGKIVVKDIYLSPLEEEEEMQSGKRQELALPDWKKFIFPIFPSRYIERNESGGVKSYWDWMDQGGETLWRELPVADGLFFSYEPLYDNGNEYFLMFDIEDVQGNSYSSELIPITLEKAPEKTEDADRFVWEGTENLTFYEGQGLAADLRFFRDEETGDMLAGIRARNHNSFPVDVYLTDFSMDGTVRLGCTLWMELEPMEEEFKWIPDFETICHYRNESAPDSLAFLMRATNEASKGTLLNHHAVEISFPEKMKTSLENLPGSAEDRLEDSLPDLTRTHLTTYCGARAEEQILADNDRVKITLLGLGQLPDATFDRMKVVLEIENKTDEEIPVGIYGISINGGFDDSRAGIGDLPAGMSCFISMEYWRSSISDVPQDVGVRDVSLLIMTSMEENTGTSAFRSGGTWYPITLEESSDAEYDMERGVRIFEEYGVRFGLRAGEEDFSYRRKGGKDYSWDLTISNENAQNVTIRLKDCRINGAPQDEDEFTLMNYSVGARSEIYSKIVLFETDEKAFPVISFKPQILSMGSGEVLYTSETTVEIRPEDIPKPEWEEIFYEGESSYTLCEGKGIKAELAFYRNSSNGRLMSAIRVSNDNSYDAKLSFRNIYLDQNILVEKELEVRAYRKDERVEWIPDMSLILGYEDKLWPAELSFDMEITSQDLIRQQSIRIDFSRMKKELLEKLKTEMDDQEKLLFLAAGSTLEPFLGTSAEDQILKDDDRVRVRLISLGADPYREDTLSALLEVENKGSEMIPVTIDGISMDGVFYSFSRHNYGALPGGKKAYFAVSLDTYDEPELGGAQEVFLLILTDIDEMSGIDIVSYRGGSWYPVSLKKAASEKKEPVPGQIVYEEAGIRIGYRGFEIVENEWDKDNVELYWHLTIFNDTDEHIEIEIDDICLYGDKPADTESFSGPSLYDTDTASHSARYTSIKMRLGSSEPVPDMISFTVRIRKMGYGEILHTSGTVVELKK